MSLLLPLQAAILARLLADEAVGALVGDRVYDGERPPKAPYPHIVIGEPTQGRALESQDGHGYANTASLHAWSSYPGSLEAMNILAAIEDALSTPLVIAGFGSATLREEFSTVLVERDEETVLRHAPARYRVTAWPS